MGRSIRRRKRNLIQAGRIMEDAPRFCYFSNSVKSNSLKKERTPENMEILRKLILDDIIRVINDMMRAVHKALSRA